MSWQPIINALRELTGHGGKVSASPTSIAGIPAVWYAVNKIGGHFGQLPFRPMKRLEGGGAEVDKDHRSYRPCKTRSNKYQTAFEYRRTGMTHCLLWGNMRAAIVNNQTEYIPLRPDQTFSKMVAGEKWHFTRPGDDDRLRGFLSDPSIYPLDALMANYLAEPDKWVQMPDRKVLHMPGFGFNGVEGVSAASVCRDAFETPLHAQKHASKWFRDGFKGKISLNIPRGQLTDEKKAKEFKEAFERDHSGEDASDVVMLREGMTATVLSMSGRDAQWIEQSKHQRQDMALIFMLESIMGDDTSVSYNSEEMKKLAYLSNNLGRFLVAYEQECDEKLLSEREKKSGSHFFKFNEDALIRTDYQTKVAGIVSLKMAELGTTNELRDVLNWNPHDSPEADELRNPAINPADDSGTDDGSEPEANGDGKSSAGGGPAKGAARQLSAPEAVQKVYLGVDTVVTSDEARQMVNDLAGSDLAVPGPEFKPAPTGSFGQPAENEPDSTQARKVILSQVSHMLGVEANRVVESTNQRNYTAWLDTFYDNWLERLAASLNLFCEHGTEIARQHCDESKSQLMDITEYATEENIRSYVESAVAGWEGRAEFLTDQITIIPGPKRLEHAEP